MKVAASMSALPEGSSSVSRKHGRSAYLMGPNRAAMTPNAPREGLVVAVCQLSAETGKKEGRENEHGAGQLNQHRPVLHGQHVNNERDESVLEQIVVKGSEELAPEEGKESFGAKQAFEHNFLNEGKRWVRPVVDRGRSGG
jgi:hypothetical protein